MLDNIKHDGLKTTGFNGDITTAGLSISSRHDVREWWSLLP